MTGSWQARLENALHPSFEASSTPIINRRWVITCVLLITLRRMETKGLCSMFRTTLVLATFATYHNVLLP